MRKWIIAGALLLGGTVLSGCSKTEDAGRMVSGYVYLEDKPEYILENENLKMVLDASTTYFQVTDKRNGTVWSSNPTAASEDPLADGENKNMLQSTLAVGYGSENGISATLNNFTYSVETGLYEIEEGNGYLKVHYSVGDAEKMFLIPPAIGESELNQYLNQMTPSSQKQVKEYYRKYDLNHLRTGDNKEELLRQYPELQEECVYVLRENLQDYLLGKLEDAFAEGGYTEEAYQADIRQYADGAGAEKPVFDVSIVYRLDEEALVVEVPFEELAWTKEFPMTKLTLLPFFGAGSSEEDGYILVPEGAGGIIQFNNGKIKQNPYYADVYGWDMAQRRTAVVNESYTAYPVFAISKQEASMMCILEEGAGFATIEADVAGRNNSYNQAHASYKILHSEKLDVSAKSDKSVVIFEHGLPDGAIRQRYQFRETGDAVELAASYREYLMKTYPELEKKTDAQAPVMVTAVGAVDKMKQRFGFPMSVPVSLTTYGELRDMMMDMSARGYGEYYLKYTGWMNGGVTHTLPKSITPVSELGKKQELLEVSDYAAKQGIHFYLEGMTMNAYGSGLLDGFQMNRDSARFASREVAEISLYSPVWYGEDTSVKPHYFLKPQTSLAMMDSLAAAASQYGAGVAYGDVGYLLGADYHVKNHISREQSAGMQRDKLKEQTDAGIGIMIPEGNDYSVAYADAVIDMDLIGRQYSLIDGFVPFYPAALHGLVPYAGEAVNLSGDYSQAVLKSAEMGAGLSFTFMMEPASTLQESSYTKYFGADYSLWAYEAANLVNRYRSEMAPCFGQFMTGHEVISDGVTVTEYEDGTKVYVNYNVNGYETAGVTVPGRDYLVARR